jgi:monoamine oxidase
MSYYEREPRGGEEPVTKREVAECAQVIAAAAANAPPQMSLAGAASSWRGSPAPLAAFLSRVTVTNGIGEDRMSAASIAGIASDLQWRPTWRVAGGAQQLAAGLAARLGPAVHLRTPVWSIGHDEDGVLVRTDDGEVAADAVIATVPMAVLRELSFSPKLPGYLRSAWQRAGLAYNAKLHLPLTAPAVTSAVQSVPGRYWTWTATDGSGQVQPVLHAFAGTEEGLAALRVADGPAIWARNVTALRQELAVDTDRALLTTWNDDPWAGESYTALTVNRAPGDDELIAAPIGRVHFAGEHTAGSWAGLMEGALRSGVRAADEVLARWA